MNEIVTKQFKIDRSRLLRSALMTRSFRLVWIVGVLLLVGGITCSVFIDWRWGLVTAMFMLVLAPGVMALLYLSYAMSPRCLPDVYPHTVTFAEKGFTVSAEVPPMPSENEETAGPQPPKRLSYTGSYGEVVKVRVTLKALVIILRGKPSGIAHIPYESLVNPKADTEYILKKCRGL